MTFTLFLHSQMQGNRSVSEFHCFPLASTHSTIAPCCCQCIPSCAMASSYST
jgi:hypothetical protein